MPGRPDFSQSGTAGGGQTVAVTERPEIIDNDVTKTANVAAGDVERVEFYAPTGAVWEAQNLYLDAPSDGDAASGDHRFTVQSASGFTVTRGVSNYTEAVRFSLSHWKAASNSSSPSSDEAQLLAVQGLIATENKPIAVRYVNKMDVAQEKTREYRLPVKEVSY